MFPNFDPIAGDDPDDESADETAAVYEIGKVIADHSGNAEEYDRAYRRLLGSPSPEHDQVAISATLSAVALMRTYRDGMTAEQPPGAPSLATRPIESGGELTGVRLTSSDPDTRFVADDGAVLVITDDHLAEVPVPSGGVTIQSINSGDGAAEVIVTFDEPPALPPGTGIVSGDSSSGDTEPEDK